MKLGISLLALFILSSCSTSRHWTGRESTVSDGAFSEAQAERILGVPVVI